MRPAHLGLLLGGVLVSLALGELLLRGIDFGAEAQDTTHGWTVRFDPELLFRLRPNSRPDINELGYRDSSVAQDPGERIRILMLGDSFTMGWNVAVEETLPARLEHHLGPSARVLNFGVLGYGPDQSFLALLRDGLAQDPALVVLNLYAGNDFEDLVKNELFDLGPDNGLVRTQTNPVSEMLPPLRLQLFWRTRITGSLLRDLTTVELLNRLFGDTETELGSPSSASTRRRIVLMRGILGRFKSLLAGKDIGFMVTILPSLCAVAPSGPCPADSHIRAGYRRNELELAGICSRVKAPCVGLLRRFRATPAATRALYAPEDFHFSARGNDLAARMILNALVKAHPERLAGFQPVPLD